MAAALTFLVAVIALALVLLQTAWAKNLLRGVIVRQANSALTARLDIGRLEGSLLGGVTLRDVRLSEEGRPLVTIETVSVVYDLREIWSHGIVIDRLRLVAPRIEARKRPDGRWDLATLVRREARQQQRTGPGRPIQLRDIEIENGTIVLDDPVAFGAVHIPSRYEGLNARLGFEYRPVRWRLQFDSMSWAGRAPALTIDSLTGALGDGPDGFAFDHLDVRTPRSGFTLSGTIHNGQKPTVLDLDVHAGRFAFQEWGGILGGLRNIAVESGFDVKLRGPVTAMATDLDLRSTAGTIAGALTLNTSVPGWRGKGTLDVGRLNLAGWLNKPDKPSDITGRVSFDLALRLGLGFPRGSYAFTGTHAGFMEYAADNVTTRGTLTAADVRIDYTTAHAYGADLTTTGRIGLDAPFPFRFTGTTVGLDLRRVPTSVPVPRVESTLQFDYDVRGRFERPYIAGRARLATSTFLGATIADGTSGTIDTLATPLRYSGSGTIEGVDLARFGRALDIAMLREPRYGGTVAGRFTLEASGTQASELDLHASGRLSRAELFDGVLHDADVRLDIAGGNLAASYDGAFDGIDPAIPLVDPRFHAALSGAGRLGATIRDLMMRSPSAADYDLAWDVSLGRSRLRGVDLASARAAGRFHDAVATLTALDVDGPAAALHGAGTIAMTETGASDFSYTVDRADLARIGQLAGYPLAGQIATTGRLTGPRTRLHLAGHASGTDVAVRGVQALSASGDYAFDVPTGDPLSTDASLDLRAQFVSVAGRQIEQADGRVTLHDHAAALTFGATRAEGHRVGLDAAVTIGADHRSLALDRLTVDLGGRWRLVPGATPPRIAWTDGAVAIAPLSFVTGPAGAERLSIGGTWRPGGGSDVRLAAENVRLASFQGAEPPPVYTGMLNADVRVTGSRDLPILTGELLVANGSVGKFPYEKLTGKVSYAERRFAIDFRLDQTPTTWATASGTVPLATFDRGLPDAPLDVRIASSPIALGLLNGLTSVVTHVSGETTLNVHVIGTARDPHFEGRIDVANAAFMVAATGVAYNRATAVVSLARDRITVESLHVEDTDHKALDVHGSLATHELKVGRLEIDVTAHDFTVMRNDWGKVAVDLALTFGGRFETPVVGGDITIASGTLNVDDILEATLFRPYATTETTIASEADPLVALNPWDRLRLNLTLHVPESLRLSGQNVQVTPGTPIGLGDINLRVGGDLVLLKDPGQPLGVYGSFDSMAGTYSFQSRRFEVQPTSSINFRGALSPELYVEVARDISGVQARVTLTGPLNSPELHLASTPPLDQSDILSLIVFNTSAVNLTAVQQQQLAVRAGALAAGFIATPLVSALESHIGLDTLEISPGGDFGIGPKVTIGEEIAPNLFARFSRQFGEYQYNQVELRYYLTRILQIRATFSDAASLAQISPFQLIERGGIDFLVFFSF